MTPRDFQQPEDRIQKNGDDVFRADDLLQRYFDGTITDEEGLELLDLWDGQPEWEKRALQHYDVNHLFRFLGNQERDETRFRWERQYDISLPKRTNVIQKKADVAIETASENGFDRIVKLESTSPALFEMTALQNEPKIVATELSAKPSVRKIEKQPLKGTLIPPSVLALIVVAWMMFAIYSEFLLVQKVDPQPSPVPFNAVARVDAVLDVDWPEQSTPLKEGRQLEPGRIRFEKGILQLVLKNDVRLALEGPIDFQLHSERNAFCGQGRLSVTVSEKGKGFEVITPLTTVVDLGTEFFLGIDENDVETHTISGKVEMKKMFGEDVRLIEGNALHVDNRGTARRFEADPGLFLDGKMVERKKVVRDGEQTRRWATAMEQWKKDTALLLNLDFERHDPSIRSGDGNVSAAVEPFEKKRIRSDAGRWIGKHGVVFRRSEDAIGIDVPKKLETLTLFVSVRIDSLAKYNQVLLASGGSHPGGIVWQMKNDGAIQLLIYENKQTPPKQFTSPPVLERCTWGSWYTIALVVDAANKKVVHYIDGHRIGEVPMEKPLPIQIDRATLGNALSSRKTTDRSLVGCVDQFMIFERPLSDTEIKNLHDLEK